jgi:hypothetical protein
VANHFSGCLEGVWPPSVTSISPAPSRRLRKQYTYFGPAANPPRYRCQTPANPGPEGACGALPRRRRRSWSLWAPSPHGTRRRNPVRRRLTTPYSAASAGLKRKKGRQP